MKAPAEIRRATPETLREALAWAQLSLTHTMADTYEAAALCECMWVLSVGNRVVAYAIGAKDQDGNGFLAALEVRHIRRGVGHGRAIAEHAIAALWAEGVAAIVLQPLLASVGFWEALGFEDDLDGDGMPLSGRMLLFAERHVAKTARLPDGFAAG